MSTSATPTEDGIDAIPQAILDRLTRVDMPAVRGIDATEQSMQVAGVTVPVYSCDELVLGSGAAGMRAAVELMRRGVDVLVASTGLFAGTSFGVSVHWVFAAVITLIFPVMVGKFDTQYIFGFFCAMMVLQLLWVIFIVPETKGRSLEHMEETLDIT